MADLEKKNWYHSQMFGNMCSKFDEITLDDFVSWCIAWDIQFLVIHLVIIQIHSSVY